MATVKTHDLIHCNPLYESFPSVNESGIYPYNGNIVRFDESDIKTFTVKKNVQARFQNILIAAGPDILNPDGERKIVTLTSIKFNGQEYLTAPTSIELIMYQGPSNPGNQLLAAFPLYTLGNYYSYTNNLANLANVVPVQGVITTGVWLYNFYDHLKTTVEALNINVNVCMIQPDSWNIDGFTRYNNYSIEKHYDDDFELEYTEYIYNAATDVLVDTIDWRAVFNGEVAQLYKDNVLQTASGEAAQFSDVNSIFSYDYDYDTIDEVTECPEADTFNTSLLNSQSCASMTTDGNCTKITFGDNSNYYNSLPGHNYSFFTSRTITMTRPDGSKYVWATSDIEGADEVIPPHYNSSNTFVYNFIPTDADGIYEFELCSYPDWQSNVFYEAFLNTIVRKNGKLYKVSASNTNVDPTSANGSSYWTEYSCIGDCEKTRYCTKEKVVVLCVSLLRCYKKLVKEAFCGIEAAPCKPMCENKKMLSAMKFKITLDSLEFSVCSEDWVSAKDQIEILKSICCCNG